MALSKAAMLKPRKSRREKVFVPELAPEGTPAEEAYVWVRAFSVAERDEWEASLVEGKGRKSRVSRDNIRAKLAVRAVETDEGHRVFQDEDAEELGAQDAAPISRIFDKAMELMGATEKDVEELEKNSERVPTSSSATDSPAT